MHLCCGVQGFYRIVYVFIYNWIAHFPCAICRDKTIGIAKSSKVTCDMAPLILSVKTALWEKQSYSPVTYSLLLEVALSVNTLSVTRNGMSENSLNHQDIFLLRVCKAHG